MPKMIASAIGTTSARRLLGAREVLELAAPLEVHARRQLHLRVDARLRVVHEADQIAPAHVGLDQHAPLAATRG